MAEIEAGEYVDVYVNIPAVERAPDDAMDANMRAWFLKSSPDILGGVTPEQWVAKMTDAGIERGLLNFNLTGVSGQPTIPTTSLATLEEFRAKCESVATICQQFPGRVFGACAIDPNRRMDAVRMVEMAVKEYDFRAIRIMHSITNTRPNDALSYPVYAKCVELGIPVVIYIGLPGPIRFGHNQFTRDLDDICVTFPDLTVVATHNGHPWHLETVALLQKHANFRLMTAGFAPKYIPEEIIYTLNTRAQHKVMFASYYPIQEFKRCVDEALELPLRPGVVRRYMRENALETFNLE